MQDLTYKIPLALVKYHLLLFLVLPLLLYLVNLVLILHISKIFKMEIQVLFLVI